MIWKTTISFIAALFLSIGINAQTPDLRNCKDWNCPSNNFTLDQVYLTLVDMNDNPIDTKSCTSGEIIKAKVLFNYSSNASNTINSTRIFADLIINQDTTYINKYVGEVPGKGEPQSQQIYPSDGNTFNWTCGTELRLENILATWRTGGKDDIEFNYNCSSYNKSQCEFPASTIVAAPLAVQFDYNICRDTGTSTVDFTSTTNGGIAPYTYKWTSNIGGSFSNDIAENTSFSTTASGDFQVTLTVIDSDDPKTQSAITMDIINPSELSISETVTDIGCDETGSGAIDITVNGGTAPFNYAWTSTGFTSSNEDIDNLPEGAYEIIVTDAYGCIISKSINVGKTYAPSEAEAGDAQSQCNDSAFTLAGNDPAVGSGVWTVESGSASIDNVNSYNSSVSVAAGVTAVLKWTITNGGCSASDTVTLTNYEAVTANAGLDDSNCNNESFTLAGNDPSIGTGTWTLVSGSATISNPNSYNSAVTVAAGNTVTLQWTITNGDCSSFDTVSLTNYQQVTTANAGEAQSQCNDAAFTLSGNDPAVGSGVWTVESGSASIDNANSYNSSVSVAAGVTAVLKWTITNGDCSSFDTVSLTNYQQVTTADAGEAQYQCNDAAFTLSGNDPAIGNGVWTVESGSASIDNANSYNSSVSVAAGVTAVLKWTITNGDCSSSDTVSLTNYQQVTTADAGEAQYQCNDAAFILAGNDPAVGSGVWTVESGSASINDANSYNSSVSVAAGVTAVLKWTITNGDCSSFDTVSLTNYQQVTTADAGEAQSQCNDAAFILAGNDPAIGNGVWTVESGSASIDNANSYNSSVSVAAGVTAVLKWTITNGDCSSFDTVSLTNYQQVTTADAGEAQSQCNDAAFTLSGNDPAVGSGVWTVESGSASINDANSYNSSVSVAAGVTAVLKWTITNGDCSSFDTVSLTNYQQVTTADAGEAQSQCNDAAFILAGNDPAIGNGVWTVESGSASIDNANSYNSSVSVAAGVTAVLKWTITNGDCSSFDTVSLTNYQQVTTADAGEAQSQCNDAAFTLSGNDPAVGSGVWTVESGSASINDANSYNSSVSVAAGVTAVLKWTITNGDCSSFDTVSLTNNILPESPVSGDDQSVCYLEGQTLTATATTPDGVSVVWYTSNEDGSVVNPTLSSVGSKTYYAEAVNDVTGCKSSTRMAITLEILPEITLSAEANTVTCNGEEDGMISFTSSDNATVTIYNSSNTDVTSLNGSLPAGIYSVVASETEGNSDASCITELEVEIKVRDNDSPVISVPGSLDLEICQASEITANNARFPLDLDGSENIIDSFSATGYTASDDQTVESITYIDEVNEEGCMPVVTRTFYVTDNCGAQSSASITINLIDNTKPFFNEPLPEQEITVECTQIPDAAVLTISDACAGNLQVGFTENKEDDADNCESTFTIIRTWAAEDCSGNMISFTQTINVIDTTAPVFDQDLPEAEITASCDNVTPAMELTATDACEGLVNVTFNETRNDNDECDTNYTLVRTWTATDCSGNKASFTQSVQVSDNTDPVFVEELPAAKVTVECDNIPDAVTLTATDNCSTEVNINFNEEITGQDDDCANEYTIIRTWIATDCAGNESSFSQTLNVVDTQAPNFNEAIPADMAMECENLPEAPVITASDNCDTQVEVVYAETSDKEGTEDKEYVVTRSWTATDCAGNTTSVSQKITIQNTGAPSFNENLPGDMTVECDAIPDAPVITASDNCVSEIEVIFSEEITGDDDACVNEYIITRTWSAKDDANNEVSHIQTITVEDTTAPEFEQALPESKLTVECDAVPVAVTLTASDNCAGSVEVTYNENRTNSDECDNTYTLVRTWTAGDCAENETTFTQTINVIDSTAPEFNEELPSEELTVECDAVPVAVTLTASDNCAGSVEVTFNENRTNSDECDNTYTLVRTWSASDCAENETTFTQTINVIDSTAPEFNEELPSQELTVECDAVPVAVTLTASDNCSGSVEVAFEELISNKDSDADNNYTITRSYMAADCAGNEASFTQIITVEDTTAPVITSCPEAVTVSADAGICSASKIELGMPVATDNCDNDLQITNNAPEVFELGDTTVTWTVTDNAGNTATCTQTVTVVDDQAPVVETMNNIEVDADAGVCGAVVNFEMIGATDNCEIASVEVTEGLVSGSEFPIGTTSVTWTVTDNAGNTATSTFTVTVEDNEAPEISCPGNMTVSTETGVSYATVDFDNATATDNCEVSVEQTGGPVSGSQFEIGTTTVTFTATDAAGNTSECSFTVTVEDNEDPTLTCPANIEESNDEGICGATIEFAELDFADNSGDATIEQTAGPAAGEVFPVGTTTVTYQVTDAAGNTAECSFTVTITDDEGPSIEQKDNITVGNDQGSCGAVVNFATPEATDNCGIESVTLTEGLDSGSEFPNGTTSVVFTATDTQGNTATSTFTVTVNDTEAPSIECPENISVTVENGTESVVVEYTSVFTIDNCEGTTVELTEGLASGEAFPVGETTITYTVTDAAGNSTSCSFTVTVDEEELPTAPAAPSATLTQATCAEPTGTITVETVEGLTYSIDGENYQTEGVFADLAPGTYDVVAQDEFGQLSELTTVVIEDPVAQEIETVSIDPICDDQGDFDLFDLLTGDYDETGNWIDTNNSGALNGNILDPSVPAPGSYTFEYIIEGNCPSITTVSLTIDDCVVLDCSIEDIKDGISKAVTPNGDNKNDVFKVDLDLACGFTYNVKIFNRWGAKVFDAPNYQNNWDGYSDSSFTSSNQLPSGTYFYILEIREGNFEPIQGYIYLGTK